MNHSASKTPGIWRFFFSPIRAESLCALRVLFGLFLVIELLVLTPVILRNVPAGGPLPLDLVQAQFDPHAYTIFSSIRSVSGVALFHLLTVIAAICMTIGFQTRWSTLFTYVAYLSFTHASHYTLDGGDDLITNTLFILSLAGIAGHTNVMYSVDALRLRRRGKHTLTEIPAWPVRMLQIQLCLLYFFSGWFKSQNFDWQSGVAMHYVVQQLAFSFVDMRWLSNFPILIVLLTYSVLFLELVFPFFVWIRPLKTPVLWAATFFHLLIRLTLHVFAFVGILPLLIIFVEPATVRRWTNRIPITIT